jgi:ATP-dependent helicase HrpA
VDVQQQLRRLAGEMGLRVNSSPAGYAAIHRALLAGLLSHISSRGEGHSYDGIGGKRVFLHPGSTLFESRPRWVVAAEHVQTTKPYARIAARIRPQWAEKVAGHLVKRRYGDPWFCPRRGRVMAHESVSLMGLVLIERRPVHFGPIAPELARSVFIREALVEGRWSSSSPTLGHNRRLIASIEARQARCRRRDLLVEDDVQEAFYAARLPADVYTGQRFEEYQATVERTDPSLLRMRETDLLRSGPAAIDEEQFPDTVTMSGHVFDLSYHFEPGHPADGVTVEVPLTEVHRLDAGRLEWLVPGYLQEKIVALIRTLPKVIRRTVVPAMDWAGACVDRLAFGRGGLVESLGNVLGELRSEPIPPEAWQPQRVPDHLRARIQVVDAAGETIAASRDLAEVHRLVGELTSDLLGEDRTISGRHDWDFDDLPEQTTVSRNGLTLATYPSLVDEGRSVGVRFRATPAQARLESRRGLQRLFLLQVAEEMAYHLEALPDLAAMERAYAELGAAGTLRDELSLRICERVFLVDRDPPRSRPAFVQRLDEGFGSIWPHALETSELVNRILRAVASLDRAMDRTIPPAWQSAVDDLRSQRHTLVPPDFLAGTPWEWLQHLPRYLEAACIRFQRLAHGGHARDGGLAATIQPLHEAWARRAREQREQGVPAPALERYRWLLEELRVSLFAPHLGTSVRVSPKRLRKVWEEEGTEGRRD